MSDWGDIAFGDLLAEPVRNGIYKQKAFHGRGAKVVNMGELFAYPRLKNVEMKRVEITETEKKKCLLKNGDLIFARRSLTAEGAGKCSIVREVVEDTTFESSIIRARPNQEKSVPDFLYYYFNSPYGKYLLGTILRQVAVSGITGSDLMELVLKIPNAHEQKIIAVVLSSLDDKIDLLHRQNQTLEAIAATLFRQWFVEEAQEDWREVRLGNYFPVVTGKKDANLSTDDGEYPFFTCSQSAIKAPSYSFEGAAILLSGNGDFNVKRYIGKFEAYQRTYVLIPYDVKYFSFLYTLIKFYLLEITGGYQGSVINFITKGMITEFKFRLPDEHINIDEKLAQFNALYEKIDSNNSQIQTLEKLRDTLLPKLMSGEVRVAA